MAQTQEPEGQKEPTREEGSQPKTTGETPKQDAATAQPAEPVATVSIAAPTPAGVGHEANLDEGHRQAGPTNPGPSRQEQGGHVAAPGGSGFSPIETAGDVTTPNPDGIAKILAIHEELTASIADDDPLGANLDAIEDLADELRWIGKAVGLNRLREVAPAKSITKEELAGFVMSRADAAISDRLPDAFFLGLATLKSRLARVEALTRSAP